MPHSSLPPRSASDSVRFGRSPGWCVGPVDRTCGTPSQDVVVPVALLPQTRTYRCGGSTGIASIGEWRAPVSRLTQGVTDLGTDNVVTASWEAVDGDDTGLPARTGCAAQVPAALGRASRLWRGRGCAESWCLHCVAAPAASPRARSLWRGACVQGTQRECTTLASISPYTVMPLPLRALVSEGW